MSRRRLALGVLGLGAVAALVVACGDSSSDASISYPKIKFVGNQSCPTASASPYGLPKVNGSKIIGQAIDEMPHLHVAPPAQVQYNHNPPTSGCHYNIANQAPILPGVYNQVIPPEYWVHNLEHGYVAILYNCPTGCQSDVQKLIDWHKTLLPDPAAGGQIPYAKVIVIPYPGMEKKFAAVSWDYYIGWDSLDINQVEAFYENHEGHAPEGTMTG